MLARWQWLILAASVGVASARAEPWMSSRFAQNCASCHAPGRVNLPPKERRCTLSCQGCHTNPNGGGMRNFYGRWTQERWLNSFYLPGYKMNKPRPQITDQQFYSEKYLKGYLDGMKEADRKRAVREGFRLRETAQVLPESEYDRRTTGENVFVSSLSEGALRIPQNDPWRQRRESNFNAGLDFRWFYLDTKENDLKKKGTMPMATDIGVASEPVHKLNFVWEGRILSDPRGLGVWDQHYTAGSMTRSAYVLVDDLPYNSFVQYGVYRPMFGHYNPDHTSLFAEATGLDMRARFKVLSVGTAPNVPFLNVHMIQPFGDRGAGKDKGFVVNAGARFVMYGMYGVLSYWSTTPDKPTPDTDVKKNMMSATGGFTWQNLTVVADITRVEHEVALSTGTPSKDAGMVMTLEPRYRFWKETYVKASYETLNTARNLKEGKVTQTGIGLSAFPISSLELELMAKNLSGKEASRDVKESATWFQFHYFF